MRNRSASEVMSTWVNRWKAGFFCIFFLANVSLGFAVENPYKDVEVDRVASSVVHEFNRFDFFESIVSAPDGTVYTTNLLKGIIYQIKSKSVKKIAEVNGKLAGLTLLDNENLIVTGSNNENEGVVYQVNIITGETRKLATLPDAVLLNGIAKMNKNQFLIADSFKGVIWKLDVKNGGISIWLDHSLLASPSVEKQMVGVNGIKIHNGVVYVSNTGKMVLAKIPFIENGSAGTPEVVHKNVFIDDFAMDKMGNIFAATHVYDSIIKITPQGRITIIAQADQGVTGSTCVTMQNGSQNILLVSTNGGILKHDPCDVVPAKIVELKLE